MSSLSRFKLYLLAGFLVSVAFAVTLAAGWQRIRGVDRNGSLAAVTQLPPAPASPQPKDSAPPTPPAPPKPVPQIQPHWTPAVALANLADLSNPDPLLNRPLNLPARSDKLTMTAGRGREMIVRTLREYLTCRQQGFVGKTAADSVLESVAKIQLYPLLYLRRAWPSQVSFVSDFNITADPLAELPVTLAPAISADQQKQIARLAATGGTWKKLLPRTRVQADGKFAVRISDRDYDLRLTTLAWGDFNRDGFEDVLLSAACSARQGGGHSCCFVVLTRTAKGAPLTVLEVRE
ncbi:MAG: hypothetical protein PHU85_05925 [Phycisphaerae bacterium]|nr:hypothetical protein [Phycisphaerae bacterium]